MWACFNLLRPSDAYICVSKVTIIGSNNGLSPSRYLNQWRSFVDWTLRNKLQGNFNQNSHIFIQENAFENVVWKMSVILSRSQCGKSNNSISPLKKIPQKWGYQNSDVIHYIPKIMNMVCTWLCFAVVWYWSTVPISSRTTSLAIGQSYKFDVPVQVKQPWTRSGVGVTKPISSIPLFPQIFSTVKIHVNYKLSRSYLTGVTAAELRRHLANMNEI